MPTTYIRNSGNLNNASIKRDLIESILNGERSTRADGPTFELSSGCGARVMQEACD